jgi:hypothetical protein
MPNDPLISDKSKTPYDGKCVCPSCGKDIDLTIVKERVSIDDNCGLFAFAKASVYFDCDKCGSGLSGKAWFMWDYQADSIDPKCEEEYFDE